MSSTETNTEMKLTWKQLKERIDAELKALELSDNIELRSIKVNFPNKDSFHCDLLKEKCPGKNEEIMVTVYV